MFRDLTEHYSIGVLDKSGKTLTYTMGQVVNKGPARYEQKGFAGTLQMPAERVMDLTIDIDGKSLTFVVPENGNVASNEMYTISCDSTIIANEVRSRLKKSQDIIANIPNEEENIKACQAILDSINPPSEEAQAYNRRLDKMEEYMTQVGSSLAKIEKLLAAKNE